MITATAPLTHSQTIIRTNRIESIDLLRGLVMIIMALDHVRDYFHADAFLYNPLDLEKTSVALFFTRWITHFCAPVFVFLAGTSAYLVGVRKGKKELSKFLLTRGLWLLVLELTVINFAWFFNVQFSLITLTVIWALAIGMIALAGAIHLPFKMILLLGFLFVAGHNTLDGIHVDGEDGAAIASICLFSFSTRILNISMNTQAIALQKKFDKTINGSFHALWSTGGIIGVCFSTALVAYNIEMDIHLLIVSAITFVTTLYCHRFLLRNDRSPAGNKIVLGKPDPYIVYLGLIIFLAAICEGGMFDWSGVYFKEVVNVEIFTWGYLTFMICMAISRFASDRVMERIGMEKTFVLSASLIFCGTGLAVLFPTFVSSMIGFCLVGLGTASVIPMVFLLAGNSTKYSPGMAISIIATYSIVGMLIGPPMIGYLAHAFSLRVSFVAFSIAGLMLIPISQIFFRHQKTIQQQKAGGN